MKHLAPLALVLASCTVGPDFEPPGFEDLVAPGWTDAAAGSAPEDLAVWWERFDDPELVGLIERALGESLRLDSAAERIAAVRARRGVARSASLPQLDLEPSYTRLETGDEGFAPGGVPSGIGADLYANSAVLGWELDLWGRVRRLTEAADAEVEFAVEDYRAVRVALIREIVVEWITIRALDAERAAVENGLEADLAALEIARARRDAGVANALDAERAARVLSANRALVPELAARRRQSELRMAVLLGAAPSEVSVASAALPEPAELPAAGAPAELLARRPDLRRAERALAAASARVGARMAERLPRLTLGGSLSLQGPDASSAFDLDAFVIGLGPRLTLPLLDGGRRKAEVDVAESERAQAVLELKQALVDALAEVETAAALHRGSSQRLDLLRAAEAAARETERLALDRYDAGAVDFLEVTEATTQRLRIERDRISAQRDVLRRQAELYGALGGGWSAG